MNAGGRLAVAILVVPLALSACSAAESKATAAKPGESQTTSASATAAKPRYTVRMDGALTRIYAVPTLTAFVAQPAVTNVIDGTVTATRPIVTQPGNTVETILTVAVDRQRDVGGPTTVEVREQGGIVRVSEVRSDFEDKLGRKLTEKELSDLVDFRFDGIDHASVGDHILVVVAADTPSSAKNAYTSLARLKQASQGTSLSSTGATFVWPGESPNPAWAVSVDPNTLMK